jgi:hypothetical protein
LGGGVSALAVPLTSCAKSDEPIKNYEFTSIDQINSHLIDNVQTTTKPYTFNPNPGNEDDYNFVKNQLNIQVITNGLLYGATGFWGYMSMSSINLSVGNNNTVKAEIQNTLGEISTLDISYKN